MRTALRPENPTGLRDEEEAPNPYARTIAGVENPGMRELSDQTAEYYYNFDNPYAASIQARQPQQTHFWAVWYINILFSPLSIRQYAR